MHHKTDNGNEPLTLDGLAQYTQEVLLPAIDSRFEKRDDVLDRHGKVLAELKAEISEVKSELKGEISEVKDKVLTALDQNTVLLEKISTEQAAVSHAIIRHDEKIEQHDEDIAQLKEKVGV